MFYEKQLHDYASPFPVPGVCYNLWIKAAEMD